MNQPPQQAQQAQQAQRANGNSNSNSQYREDEKLTLEASQPVFKEMSLEEQPVFRSLPQEALQIPQFPNSFRGIALPQAPQAPHELLGQLEPSWGKVQPMTTNGPVQLMDFNSNLPFPKLQALFSQFSTVNTVTATTMATSPFGSFGVSSSSPKPASRNAELAEQLDRILTATIPELPAYVEKYTSFPSNKLPREVFEKVVKALQEMPNVDFDLNGSLAYVAGTYYDGHVSARFQINLFKRERGYLVEVQRRCGDCLAFNQFYQVVKAQLAAVGLVDGLPAKPVDRVPIRAPPAYDIILNEAALGPLQSMAESDYVDVAREGMKMLAKCSMTQENAALIVAKCLPLLQLRLRSADEELFRYASFILSNITKVSNVCLEVSSQAAAVNSVFQALESADNKEVRRLLAQCAANFALVNTQAIASENYRHVLRRHRASSDSRLASLVESTLARVEL